MRHAMRIKVGILLIFRTLFVTRPIDVEMNFMIELFSIDIKLSSF